MRDEITRPPPAAGATHRLLRVMATTDLHGRVLPWDYLADAPAPGAGLAVLAGMARRLRAEAPGAVLVDCGDFLQGGPFEGARGAAVVAAMNAAGIDAAALGNHDFDFGLAPLRRAEALARFPLLSANVRGAGGEALFAGWRVLERDLGGGAPPLRLGVIGITPPRLGGRGARAASGGPGGPALVEAAGAAAEAARASGADLVLALCHGGPGTGEPLVGDADVASAIAALGAVDAVVAGHVHETLARSGPGAPLVMPGFGGSHLGVIDLDLAREGGRWSVASARARLAVPGPSDAPDPQVLASAAAAHEAARARLSRIVGRSPAPIDGRFSLARPCPALALVAEAKRRALAEALSGGDLRDLAVIGAAACHSAASRPGAGAAVRLGAGPVRRRDLDRLYPYPNRLAGVLVTGAGLAEWLERSASCYALARAGARGPLLSDEAPAWFIDVLHGPDWRIDLSAPPLFGPGGERLGGPGRVRDLRLGGRAVDADERLIVATNDFRIGGGGPFGGFFGTDRARIVHRSEIEVRALVAAHLAQGRPPAPLSRWSFEPLPGASATFDAPEGCAAGGGARARHALPLDLRGAAPSPISRSRG